jgi:archaetidylinositol phosphate synthase
MTLYKERERFQDLSIRIGIAFSKLRLSPNQWTLISILPVLAAAWLLYYSQFLVSALLLLLSAFLDLVDGSVARVTGRVSLLGAYLDTIVDRYIEFIIILGILLVGLPGFYLPASVWILVYLFGAMMTTYSKAAAKEKDIFKREIRGGILERAERLIILFVGLLLAAVQPIYLTYVISILAVLTNITALQRIGKVVGRAKE